MEHSGGQHRWPGWRTALAIGAAALGLWNGCSHHPVYPDYGSARITSDPDGAEIMIDGESTRRTTPCKLDGLGVGPHALTLRMWNYQVQRQTIAIEPAQTAHLNVRMQEVTAPASLNRIYGGRDFAYDPVNQRIYIASMGTQCLVCEISDTVVTPLYGIELGIGQYLVAVSPVTNRVFCLAENGALAMADPNAPNALRWLVLPGMAQCKALLVSPDGNMVVASDYANQRLVLIDARLGSVIRYIGLPGSPGDLLFTPSGSELYVLLPPQRKLVRVDLASGAVLATLATGNAPNGLFWSSDRRSVGFCNRSDNSLTMVSIAAWSGATAAFSLAGTWGSYATDEPNYIFFMSYNGLCCCYLPEWEMSYLLNSTPYGSPVRIIASRTPRRYYLLGLDQGITVIDTHF